MTLELFKRHASCSLGRVETVQKGDRILLEFELSTEDEVIDAATSERPLELEMGTGRLHPAIEAQIIGASEGQNKEIVLDPSLGFGEVDPQLRFTISKRKMPENFRNLPVGSAFESVGPDRKMHLFRIVEFDGPRVTIDGNHPLSGLTLYLNFRVLKILRG